MANDDNSGVRHRRVLDPNDDTQDLTPPTGLHAARPVPCPLCNYPMILEAVSTISPEGDEHYREWWTCPACEHVEALEVIAELTDD